jgi:hypothetical protein
MGKKYISNNGLSQILSHMRLNLITNFEIMMKNINNYDVVEHIKLNVDKETRDQKLSQIFPLTGWEHVTLPWIITPLYSSFTMESKN